MKQLIYSDKVVKPVGPYSQAIKIGNTVYCAGQIYLKADGTLNTGSNEDQIRQVMENLRYVLEASGASLSDIVKTTVYVTDMAKYKFFNQIYGEYVSDPYPARETVCVKELPLGVWLEISAVAVIA